MKARSVAWLAVLTVSCGDPAAEVSPGAGGSNGASSSSTSSGTTTTSETASGEATTATTATTSTGTTSATTTSTTTTTGSSTSTTTGDTTGNNCSFDPIFDDDPILYWRLGETQGTEAIDETDENQTGTYLGVTLDIAGVAWDGDTAVRFDGNTQSRLMLNPVGAFPSDEFTIEFFTRTTDNSGGFISYATNQSDNDIYIDDPDQLDLLVTGTGPQTAVGFADGQWHHVAITWRNSDGRWRMYVDGAVEAEGFDVANDASLEAGGSLYIAQDQDSVGGNLSNPQALEGEIDELIIYDQEFGPARVDAHRRAILCL